MGNIINPYSFGGAPFSPTDIAGLELWHDQSDLTTLWQDSARTTQVTGAGDPVGAWDDKSGNGGHAKQATAGNKPTYQTTGVTFDGGDWLDNVLYVPAARPVTIFAVAKASVDSAGTIVGIVDSSQDDDYCRILLRGTGVYSFNYRSGIEDLVDTSSTYDDGNIHAMIGMETSATSRDVWVDGADNASGSTNLGVFTPDVVSIGRTSDSTPGSEWDDLIMEIIIYNTALSTADRQDVENYLISKWGVT